MAIYFGSNTDEGLDDYEEGTFSSNWHSNNSSVSNTNYGSNNHSRYIKIGNMVHVSMYCYQSHSSGSNGPWQSFMPFTSNSAEGTQSAGTLMADTMDSGSSALFWNLYKPKNTTILYIFYQTKNQGWAYQETGHDSTMTLIGQITYEAA